MQPQHWLRAWKKTDSIRRLSGLTLPHSTACDGVASWICSLRARPANPTAPQACAEASTTSAAAPCSRTSQELSTSAAPGWSLWKTCGAGGQVDIFETSESAYSEWVTESCRRSDSLRATLARRIGASADSAWPTANVQDSASAARHTTTTGIMHPGTTLTDAVRGVSWDRNEYPTPSATRYGSSQNEGSVPHDRPSRGTPSLETWAARCKLAAGLWDTPQAADARGQTGPASKHSDLSRQAQTTASSGDGSPQNAPNLPRRLNPHFVEWLMGWPIGWTDAAIGCGVPETEWCRWLALSRSMFSCLRSGYERSRGLVPVQELRELRAHDEQQ